MAVAEVGMGQGGSSTLCRQCLGKMTGILGYTEDPGRTVEAKADAGLVNHRTLQTGGDQVRQLESRQDAGQGLLWCSV